MVSYAEIQEHLKQEEARQELAYRELIDAARATTDITMEQVRDLVRQLLLLSRTAPFGPTAIVAANDTLFGMASMFAILLDISSGPLVAVFRVFNEALDWLVRAAPAKPGAT